MKKTMRIFLKTVEAPFARFEADEVHNHTEGLITFLLEGKKVAQATRDNIEYWYAEEEESEET